MVLFGSISKDSRWEAEMVEVFHVGCVSLLERGFGGVGGCGLSVDPDVVRFLSFVA